MFAFSSSDRSPFGVWFFSFHVFWCLHFGYVFYDLARNYLLEPLDMYMSVQGRVGALNRSSTGQDHSWCSRCRLSHSMPIGALNRSSTGQDHSWILSIKNQGDWSFSLHKIRGRYSLPIGVRLLSISFRCPGLVGLSVSNLPLSLLHLLPFSTVVSIAGPIIFWFLFTFAAICWNSIWFTLCFFNYFNTIPQNASPAFRAPRHQS